MNVKTVHNIIHFTACYRKEFYIIMIMRNTLPCAALEYIAVVNISRKIIVIIVDDFRTVPAFFYKSPVCLNHSLPVCEL